MTRKLALAAALAVLAGCGGKQTTPTEERLFQPPANVVKITATRSSTPKGALRAFHSQKTLRPPAVTVLTKPAKSVKPGLVFLTPRTADPDHPGGPTIVDTRGRVVWHNRRAGRVTGDLQPQTFKGKPVLTWAERPPVTAPAEIFELKPEDVYNVLLDQRYREIAKVRATGDGVVTDLHEMLITEKNTAFVVGFRVLRRDLSSLGATPSRKLVDAVVQEVDLVTGNILLDWRASDHVDPSESYFQLPKSEAPWDTYHVNSVALASDGNLLISMRHTSAVYKVERKTGRVLWTLGGKRSDFRMGRGARFYFQHDAQPTGGGKLLLFDNEATFEDRRADHSRVIELKLDGARRRATLVREILHDEPILAVSQGNSRVLENGNIFVGWGNQPWFSEYSPDGRQVFDATLPSNKYQSYRAFKGAWAGRPTTRPAVVADRIRDKTVLWISWNGATEVAHWRILGGVGEGALKPLGTTPWLGFETRIEVGATPRVLRLQALDRHGKVLGGSRVVRP